MPPVGLCRNFMEAAGMLVAVISFCLLRHAMTEEFANLETCKNFLSIESGEWCHLNKPERHSSLASVFMTVEVWYLCVRDKQMI